MNIPSQHLITVNATNHHGYLINKLWEFIQNKHKTDMCILSNGQMIQAHQLILEVFTSQEQLGYAALHDNNRNLDKILEFMYTGEIKVQPEDLDSLLHLAADLGLGMLVDALEAAKSNSSQIYPENIEREKSHMMQLALIDSNNHAVCDSMPLVPIVPMFEPCSDNCHVKQEPLDQINVEDFNLPDTQNVVALENGEGQFVDSLEIHEEVPDIVKHESNVDINACSSNMVAGWNESGLVVSVGHPPVPTINESASSCANPTSPYPLRKQSRKNYSECDSLLDPDWKGSTVDENMSSKGLTNSHGQILPVDASAVGLTETCKQRKLKNPSKFRNGNDAKCSKLNNANQGDEGNQSKRKCSVCSKVVDKYYLKAHMRGHTGERPFACPQCPKKFSKSSDLSRHILGHTGERPFACPQCPKTFSLSSNLSQHMSVHTGDRPFACPQCPKTFSQSSKLSRHIRVHTGVRPHSCLQCPKTFFQSFDLSRHMLVHTGERPHACPQCPKTFSKSSDLSRHIHGHTGERPFACPQCPKTFSLSSNLSHHMTTHTGVRPHACLQCPKTFSRSGSLSTHMRVHTGERPYACPQCPKFFSESSKLSTHMRVHTGERPHACPQCPKTFSQSSKLSRHMRVHTGERPYACPQCPKTYSQLSHLSTHMQVHTGVRPHACLQCPKTFSRSFDLSRHMQIHTG